MNHPNELRQARLRMALRTLIAAGQADRELITDENWIIATSRIITLLGTKVEGELRIPETPKATAA